MRRRLRAAREAHGPAPIKLVSIEVGENPAAAVYLRGQKRAANDVGIELHEQRLDATASTEEIIATIAALNDDPRVSGILLQRPLPLGVDARDVQDAIRPDKDVEGMHPRNMGAILYREPPLAPCTASAAMHMILQTGKPLEGAEAVVVGHSEIVGKPIAMFLLHHLSTVTVCHVGTRDLSEHTRRADILVVAVGKAGLVTGDMVQPGAVVIDIGINAKPGGGICGDVHFDSTKDVASAITPVPGGVGPVTVSMLMRNTLRAAGVAI